jgi:DNA helicase-2/ATP-dependent DNA helicase PcrA
MTMHSAKGLEFPYVYIVGWRKSFPKPSACKSRADLEEERRLFYVALDPCGESAPR